MPVPDGERHPAVSLEDFFEGSRDSRRIFEALRRLIGGLHPSTMAVTKSQIAFRRRRAFAWAWIPDRYLRGKHAPLVLSLAFGYRDPSPRWKQVVQPGLRSYMHHLELYSPADLDDEVESWISEAWAEAG